MAQTRYDHNLYGKGVFYEFVGSSRGGGAGRAGLPMRNLPLLPMRSALSSTYGVAYKLKRCSGSGGVRLTLLSPSGKKVPKFLQFYLSKEGVFKMLFYFPSAEQAGNLSFNAIDS